MSEAEIGEIGPQGPAMPFEVIDAVFFENLQRIEASHFPKALAIEQTQLLMISTMSEILKTLKELHPNYEKKEIFNG